MAKTKWEENLFIIIFTMGLIFVGISLIINTSKSCDVHIDYDVSIKDNETIAESEIVQIQFACYKLCVEELKGLLGGSGA